MIDEIKEWSWEKSSHNTQMLSDESPASHTTIMFNDESFNITYDEALIRRR